MRKTTLPQSPTIEKGSAAPAAESERLFQLMADSAPVALWMSGRDGLCYFFNHGWLRFTGRKLEEELGSGWAEGVHPEDFQDCVEGYQRAFDARREFKMEYRLRRHDGEYRWILDHGRPRYAADGAFAGFVGSCIDITERKAAEAVLRKSRAELEAMVGERTRELEAAYRELKRSHAELQQFAYAASHDLGEPLRKVAGFLALLSSHCGDGLDAQGKEYLEKTRGAAERMHRLINDLLEYCRLGTKDDPPARVDCASALEAALENLRLAAQESGAAITHGPLPTVRGHAVQLMRLFQNLVGNAIKFRKTGVAPRIHVSAERQGLEWVFSVRDNGIGIAKADLSRVFAIFQRLHSRSEYPGTGIGLAVCQKTVELHGGRIWVESEPGEGSTFRFTFPAA